MDGGRNHTPLRRLQEARPARQTRLVFDDEAVGVITADTLRRNLSAVEFVGDDIWVVGDEKRHIDRLTQTADGGDETVYAHHRRFSLNQPFALDGVKGELDLEGLCRDESGLWLLGSHCRTRRSVARAWDDAHDGAEALEAMKLRRRRKTAARCFLGRLDLAKSPPSCAPFPKSAGAMLPVDEDGNELLKLLSRDGQLAPFLELPAKENGVDFEGLAVTGEAVFVGLRGPVIGGLALILELNVRIDAGRGQLELRKVRGGERLVKHALDLQGLGVRDLALHGDEMLILAAPTAPLDGMAVVFRWSYADRSRKGGVVHSGAFAPMLRLPGGDRGDYAEGLAATEDALTIAYDNPKADRISGEVGVKLDVFTLD